MGPFAIHRGYENIIRVPVKDSVVICLKRFDFRVKQMGSDLGPNWLPSYRGLFGSVAATLL